MADRLRLGEVAKVISGYAFKSSAFTNSGVPVVKIANIRIGNVDLRDCQYVAHDYIEALDEKYRVLAGDVLISLTGSQITQPNSVVGRVARQSRSAPLCLLNQRVGKVIIKHPHICDKTFVYYALFRCETRKILASMGHGAASQANVSPSQVESLEIPNLPVEHQRRIAAVLSAYDDLVENNTRRIQILEEMARRIYEEWFVRFRFPEHQTVRMVETELGPIPEGWKLKRLGEVLELVYGKALKADEREEGNVPVYGSSGIVGFHGVPLVDEAGIIVGRKGNVGSVHLSDVPFYPIDTVYYIKTELPLSYVFFNLKRQNFINNDAAVPGLNRNQARSLPFILPADSLVNKFDGLAQNLFGLSRKLQTKNGNLRRTRDLLLPKLISGEIDVSNFPEPVSL